MSGAARGRRRGAALAGLLLGAALAVPWPGLPPADLMEDAAGARCLPPLTRAHALQVGAHRTWVVVSLRRVESGWEFTRAGRPARLDDEEVVEGPSARFYLLGTDGLGRDVTVRLLAGIRHSLIVGVLCVGLALAAGAGVGGAAGLAGGWLDAVLMRGVDVVASVPRLVFFLLCAALVEPSTAAVVAVLAATTWTGLARIVRAEVLAVRSGDAALAARALGAPGGRLLVGHVLPALAPVLGVAASLRFADTIVLESALSFLGLGAPHPAVSLGDLIASGREVLAEAWWVAALPGVVLVGLQLGVRAGVKGLLGAGEPPSLV